MEKGWKHKKSSNKNKFKVGDIVSYSDGVQKFEGKITGDFTDEKFYVGDKYGYQVTGFGDRLKPEQLTLVTKKMAKGGGVEGYEDLSFVKPNLIKTSETSAFGNPDKLILNYNGKKIAQFYYNMRGYNSDFSLKNSDGVHWGFGGDKSKTRQLSDFKKALKEGFVFIKNYTFKDGGKMAKGGEVGKTMNKEKIGDEVYEFLKANGYELESISEGASGEIIIEPSTRKTGNQRKDFFDGMQIIRFPDGTYEVSEYMAGPKEDEMYIYKETKSLKVALKDLIKGNKRKPIKKYAKGGGVKSSINTYKLRAEGLNDFLAFLQQGMYFRVKSFTVETTSGPDVVVSFTTDASLSEIKSKLDEVPDSHVMLETIKPIKEYTGERNEEYAKGGGVGESKLDKLKTEGKLKTLVEVNGQKYFQTILPNKQEKGYWKRYYSTNQNSVGVLQNSMLDEDDLINLFEQQSKKMATGGGVGTSSKLKYSLYLDRTVGDNVTTYHIADFAAKGDLSIALESLKEAAPKNYMYYTK